MQNRIIRFECGGCAQSVKAPVEWAGTEALCRTCGARNIVPAEAVPESSGQEPARAADHDVPSNGRTRRQAIQELVNGIVLRDLACKPCGTPIRYADDTCVSCGRPVEYETRHRNYGLREEGLVILEELADYSGRKVPIHIALRKFAKVYAIGEVLGRQPAKDMVLGLADRVSVATVLAQSVELAVHQKRDSRKRSALAKLPDSWLIVRGPGPDYRKLKSRVEELLVPE